MNCANCHGKEGEGLRQLYPALVNNPAVARVDYLTCLIREGGKDMPANKELYAIDIAQISTYIKYKWADDKSITETADIEKVDCATVQK
jgi:mono/diheme cytochrome c family protein